jgi:Glycosyl transferase family 2
MSYYSLVSVIIPTYNYAHYICEAIDSILASDFPEKEIEIIVIDDGSTDNTEEKIKNYGDRIHYISLPNSGKAYATKIGIEKANGKYIFNLDADDLFLPSKITKVVSTFESDQQIVHVGHPALCWHTRTNQKNTEKIPKPLLNHKMDGKALLRFFYTKGILFGGGSTFAVRSKNIKSVPIPKEVDMYIDEYLVLSALSQGCSILLDQPLSLWRIHDHNFSGETSLNQALGASKIQRCEDSINAIQDLLSGIVPEEIEILYQLKTKVIQLKNKEYSSSKSWHDLIDLIATSAHICRYFGLESPSILQNYRVGNRLIPTSILSFLRQLIKRA